MLQKATSASDNLHAPALVECTAAGLVSVAFNGRDFFTNVRVDGYAPTDAWEFGIGASTGAWTDAHRVARVRLHTDAASGASRGFAHVVFADDASLERAMARSGEHVRGRPIKLGYSDTFKGKAADGAPGAAGKPARRKPKK